MIIKPEYRKKSIRSYVVRAGRMTPAQRQAFDGGWSRYGLKLSDGVLDAEREFGTSAPLIVEIGFGMGDSLLQMAQAAPDCQKQAASEFKKGLQRVKEMHPQGDLPTGDFTCGSPLCTAEAECTAEAAFLCVPECMAMGEAECMVEAASDCMGEPAPECMGEAASECKEAATSAQDVA